MSKSLIIPLAKFFAGEDAPVAVAILSLDDCLERRSNLISRGLPIDWVENYWPAADLRRYSTANIVPFFNAKAAWDQYHRNWRSSEVGCAFSHRSAMLSFLSTSAQLLLVLEDDVIPTTEVILPALNRLIRPLLQARPQPLLCHLGPKPEHIGPSDLRPLQTTETVGKVPLKVHQNRNRPLWRAHAYLISRKSARRSLALETNGLYLLADDWQSRRMAGVLGLILVADPPLFLQDNQCPSTQKEEIPAVFPHEKRPRLINFIVGTLYRQWLILIDRLLRYLPYRLE